MTVVMVRDRTRFQRGTITEAYSPSAPQVAQLRRRRTARRSWSMARDLGRDLSASSARAAAARSNSQPLH
jgi:hypothetical protein